MKKHLTHSIWALLVILLAACSSTDTKSGDKDAIDPSVVSNPATASGKPDSESLLPEFSFPVETYDFGSIKEGESISYSFEFTNKGKSDLLISSANGSCGCTIADYPKEAIAPGKGSVVKVTFDSKGKQGMQHKTVTLVANTIPNSKVLTITGEVVAK
jgi:hypothetical protein